MKSFGIKRKVLVILENFEKSVWFWKTENWLKNVGCDLIILKLELEFWNA